MTENHEEKNSQPTSDINTLECAQYRPVKEFSHLHEVIDNLPYIVMIFLGSLIIYSAKIDPAWRVSAAVSYFVYGILGALWIVIFICPYCHFYGTRSCPCGYGQIASRLVPRKDGKRFSEKFKKHIPVIVPLWLIPVAAAIYRLVHGFSAPISALSVVFVIDSFIVLPLVSKQYGCAHCDQKETCPWMAS